MSADHIQAYEGSEPYVFISYAHKDSAIVYNILRRLDERGVRIWYDDGIAPGSEWPDYIADHLLRASAVIAFITDNSVQSANCRREITFALSKNKPFISVFPGYVNSMSSGLELQLSAQQSVFRQNFKDEESFINKIVSTPFIIPCLRPAEKPVHAVAISVLNPESDVAKREAAAKTKAQLEAERLAAEEAAKEAARAARKKDKAVDGTKKKKWILPVCIAAFILICAGTFFFWHSLRIVICGDVYGPGTAVLTLRDETVTEKDVLQINRLKKLSSLSFENCTFVDNSLDSLIIPETLSTFCTEDCTGVHRLDFLSDTSLYYVNLFGCALTDDQIPDLSSTQIYHLDLHNNPDITEIPQVNVSDISFLDISDTAITYLTPVSQMSDLTQFNASNCPITNLAPLARLTKLTSLTLRYTDVRVFDDDIDSLEIHTIDFTGTPLTSAKALENQSKLVNVSFAYTLIDDISFLSRSSETLEFLNLYGCTALDTDDIDVLSSCTQLRELYLADLDLSGSDLSFAKNMASLQYFHVIHCGLQSVAGIGSHPDLITLRLALNEITDVAPLANVSSRTDFNLDLAANNISNATPLGIDYHVLSLMDNPITSMDFSSETEYPRYYLLLDYFDGLQNMDTANLYTWIFIYDVPKSEQVAMKDANYNYIFCQSRGEQLENSYNYFDYWPWADYLPEWKLAK